MRRGRGRALSRSRRGCVTWRAEAGLENAGVGRCELCLQTLTRRFRLTSWVWLSALGGWREGSVGTLDVELGEGVEEKHQAEGWLGHHCSE